MTKTEEVKPGGDKFEFEIDVKSIQSNPDYLGDPIEDIEEWVNTVFPEELRPAVIDLIKEARNKNEEDKK